MESSVKEYKIGPDESGVYEFELLRGENLKGVISSSSPIDIYLIDNNNFNNWMNGKPFDFECSNKSVFEMKIDYLAPRNGTWYVLTENNGRKKAKVEITLNISN